MFSFFTFTKKLRPLRGAHWGLSASLICIGLLLSVAQSCSTTLYYLWFGFLVALVMTAAWVNHLRFAPISNTSLLMKVATGSIFDLFKLVLIWLVCMFPLAIFMPTDSCYSDRARAAEIAIAMSDARQRVAAQAESLGKIEGSGAGISFSTMGRATAGIVTKDGIVIAAGDEPPIVFLMSPTYVAGKVEWRCQAFPSTSAPLSCRPDNKPSISK